MRTAAIALCLLLAVAAVPGVAASDSAAANCFGIDSSETGFTGTCTTPECGYIYVLGSYAGEYGPCVGGDATA